MKFGVLKSLPIRSIECRAVDRFGQVWIYHHRGLLNDAVVRLFQGPSSAVSTPSCTTKLQKAHFAAFHALQDHGYIIIDFADVQDVCISSVLSFKTKRSTKTYVNCKCQCKSVKFAKGSRVCNLSSKLQNYHNFKGFTWALSWVCGVLV